MNTRTIPIVVTILIVCMSCQVEIKKELPPKKVAVDTLIPYLVREQVPEWISLLAYPDFEEVRKNPLVYKDDVKKYLENLRARPAIQDSIYYNTDDYSKIPAGTRFIEQDEELIFAVMLIINLILTTTWTCVQLP